MNDSESVGIITKILHSVIKTLPNK